MIDPVAVKTRPLCYAGLIAQERKRGVLECLEVSRLSPFFKRRCIQLIGFNDHVKLVALCSVISTL